MAELLQRVSDIVWAESFWLPGNRTWDVLKNTDNGIYHAQLSDLLVPVYLSVAVYAVKYIFENYVFGSIGHALGLKAVVKKATPNPHLENAYRVSKSPSNDIIQGLAKQTDLTTRQVERWFRVRRNQDRTPVFKKFVESSWRGLFYFFIFWWGVWIHLDKPWFYETIHCWKGWPEHHISDDIYWYYMVEGAFYLSLLFSLFTDHKRKDFVEMVVHHVATLTLMTLSWVNNFVRIGTLVLLVHDAVDSSLEAAKVAKYIGQDKACEILFFTFMVVWVITRMTIFPFRIIYSTMFESLPALEEESNGLFTIYVVYNFLLCTLQVLHIIWFYYIALIAYDAVRGQMRKDSRSSLESASESEDDTNQVKSGGDEAVKDGVTKALNGVVKTKNKTS
ncbi:ceramide synthase 2 [Aplysia californica]|uniref:Ceramide synthase 2 n=1 Tax=Aplysia californica TaxID=6500 RepID=A0ABM0JPM4_APLCA|nr:ceramide synthase 2 [Aplysia californica]